MNINYENIVEANKGIAYTDVRGKNYAEVAQRVQAFRKLIPDGYITTDVWKFEDGVVYMKAEAGYYAEDGRRVMLGTGLAYERQDASNLNKTSFIENCETSAVGRALGFLGLGSEKSIASAEEVGNAISTQEAIEAGKIADPTRKKAASKPVPVKKDAPAVVETSATLPKPDNPVQTYLANEKKNLQKARQISAEDNAELFTKQLAILRSNGLAPNKGLSAYTMEEAQTLIGNMYTRFTPNGTELKDA